jgi:hypothetical protein
MSKKYDPSSKPSHPAQRFEASPGPKTASYGLYYEEDPTDEDANGKSWYTRNQNLIVNYIEAKPGATFTRKGQKDEYMLMVPDDDTPYEISAMGETRRGPGYQLIVVPPGDSEIKLLRGGRFVRLFTTQSDDLNAKCANAAAYAEPDPNVAPFRPWPAPPSGYKLRIYDLWRERSGGFWGALRCTTMMMSFPPPVLQSRDPGRMSPHAHADFDQCSLLLEGSCIHHMRWMWGLNQGDWRDDEHALVHSPSATMMPAQVVHTSERLGRTRMGDFFAPPRIDFALREGFFANADEYPLPQEAMADA